MKLQLKDSQQHVDGINVRDSYKEFSVQVTEKQFVTSQLSGNMRVYKPSRLGPCSKKKYDRSERGASDGAAEPTAETKTYANPPCRLERFLSKILQRSQQLIANLAA